MSDILIKGMEMPSIGNETIIRIQSGGGILDQYGHHLYCEAIPAADVRPVVLCRDCKNSYEWANADGDNYRYCDYLRSRWNHDTDRMVNDDDFCKWGEKREES